MEDNDNDFLILSGKNIFYSFVGIIGGILINQIGATLYHQLNITNKNIKIIGQIILCSILFAYVQTRLDERIAWEWQNVTPGIFFTAFFFGVQYLSFTTIEEIYGINPLLPKEELHKRKQTTTTR